MGFTDLDLADCVCGGDNPIVAEYNHGFGNIAIEMADSSIELLYDECYCDFQRTDVSEYKTRLK